VDIALAVAGVVGLFAPICPPCAIIGVAGAVGSVAMGVYKASTGRPEEGARDIILAAGGGLFGAASKIVKANTTITRIVTALTKPANSTRVWARAERKAEKWVTRASTGYGALSTAYGVYQVANKQPTQYSAGQNVAPGRLKFF